MLIFSLTIILIEKRNQDAHAKKPIVLKCIVNVFQLERCAPLNVHAMDVITIAIIRNLFSKPRMNSK